MFMIIHVDNGSIYSKYKTHIVDYETVKAPGECSCKM